MLKIKEAIVVEGRYDKNTLSQLVDTVIVETGGFQVFKQGDRLNMLRLLAQRRGLIILTDSDGAGFVIRNFLKGAIPPSQVKHAYIPDLYGKEKRKAHPGKEGKLGVEGMRPEVLETALRRAGATILGEDSPDAPPARPITKADLFRDGLVGGYGSAEKRKKLEAHLGLPQHLSSNSFLQVLNSLMCYEEYVKLVGSSEEDL
jgi:ribonuclease M5